MATRKARLYKKNILLEALKEAGLPYTMPNFVMRYENTLCKVEGCEFHGEPYLYSPRNDKGDRIYTKQDVRDIVRITKLGWFNTPRHFHWYPKGK